MGWFEIAIQCCDAKNYLGIGQACAQGEGCYDLLRPMGAAYWFSIPYRLNLSPDILVCLHFLLAGISTLLATFAIKKIAQQCNGHSLSHAALFLILIASMMAHAIFLYPVIHHSLSDVPAGLFILIAIWLLFLLPAHKIKQAIVLLICGILLGLAAWIRSFFLYPVLGALVLWLIACAIKRQYQIQKLFLLIALVPIATQFYVTWQRGHTLSYIDPDEAAIHQGLVLAEKAIGYDTVLPGIGFRSYPNCKNYQALGNALKEIDLHSIACLLGGKLNFYLGSYSSQIFWDPKAGNQSTYLDFKLPKNPAEDETIQSSNLLQETNIQDVFGEKQEVIRFWKKNNKSDAFIYRTVNLDNTSKYFPSVLAWSTEGVQVISLAVTEPGNEAVEAHHKIFAILTEKPQLLRLGTKLDTSHAYHIVITFPYADHNREDVQKMMAQGKQVNEGSFFIANAQLEEAELKRERLWSPVILILNVLAWMGALALLYQNRKKWHSEQWLAYTLIFLCCAEALFITPEQRFIVAPMIAAWCFCFSFACNLLTKNKQSS